MRTPGALLALALALPRVAAAQGAPVLAWTAPATCPTGDVVLSRVAALRPGFALDRSTLRATATVTPAPRGRWRVRVRTAVSDDVGERVLEARTCAQLAEATAVVLALALDAAPEAPPLAVRPSLPESVEQIDDPEAPPRPPPPPPPPPPVRTRVDLGLDGTVDPVALGGPAVLVGLHAALSRGAFRGELALAPMLPARLDGPRTGTGADLLAASATLRGCAVRARAVVSLGLCATVVGGAVWATAFGFQRNDATAWPWLAAGGGALVRVAIPRTPIAAVVRVEGVAHLTRPRLVLEGGAVVAEVPAWGLLAGLGLEMRLP